MYILVSNDDGYDAPGLWVAYDLAHKLGGKNARIAVVAPKSEQSGVGHGMTYNEPIRTEKVREDHYLVHGTPTDCIIVAQELIDQKPDLVISGVNRGHNLGPDVLYSGTVGAAIEAVAFGIPAFSLSQYYRSPAEADFDHFEAARAMGLKTLLPIWNKYSENWPEGRFCNVNFPACPASDVEGIKMVRAEALSKSNMIAHRREAPSGGSYYWLGHPGPLKAYQDDMDVAVVKQGYVTASFMCLDLCDRALCEENSELFSHE